MNILVLWRQNVTLSLTNGIQVPKQKWNHGFGGEIEQLPLLISVFKEIYSQDIRECYQTTLKWKKNIIALLREEIGNMIKEGNWWWGSAKKIYSSYNIFWTTWIKRDTKSRFLYNFQSQYFLSCLLLLLLFKSKDVPLLVASTAGGAVLILASLCELQNMKGNKIMVHIWLR